MGRPIVADAARVLADPTAYADDERLHAVLTSQRANNPVAWVDTLPYRPLWAITKHADIKAIERANPSSGNRGYCCRPQRPMTWPGNS